MNVNESTLQPIKRGDAGRRAVAVRPAEQRRASALKACATQGPEGLTARAIKRAAGMSPERRSEIGKKGAETRRLRAASRRQVKSDTAIDLKATFEIYCLTCLATGMKYVGQTRCTIVKRWQRHVYDARRYEGCFELGQAIREHGPEKFTHEKLKTVERQSAANAAEILWIKKLNCLSPHGYNLEEGGGVYEKHPATRKRMSDAKRAYWAGVSKERRSEIARKRSAAISPERRLEISRRANASQEESAPARMRAWQAARTSEERRAAAKKASEAARVVNATRTAEQYSDASRKRVARYDTRTAKCSGKKAMGWYVGGSP